ncbi:hypothetical protein K501DRAFT_166622 [Backusella circina FSU 941]|nr:hypothetical protein K501DRAFT_166622 [Backusella circina FSU 941]
MSIAASSERKISKTQHNEPNGSDITSKRRESLEKNRLAAYRCRERKKIEQKKMIERAEFLTVQNDSLKKTLDELKHEVLLLRGLLLSHDICDCDNIRAYITKFL